MSSISMLTYGTGNKMSGFEKGVERGMGKDMAIFNHFQVTKSILKDSNIEYLWYIVKVDLYVNIK